MKTIKTYKEFLTESDSRPKFNLEDRGNAIIAVKLLKQVEEHLIKIKDDTSSVSSSIDDAIKQLSNKYLL